MATPLTGIKEEMLAAFIKGLDDKIKTELRVLGPSNLEQAMEWTLNIEEKLLVPCLLEPKFRIYP